MPGKNPFVWKVNVEGHAQRARSCPARQRVRRLVYTSSIHAIKRVPHGMEMDESLGFDPNNPYGEYDRSKAAASLEVQNAALSGPGCGHRLPDRCHRPVRLPRLRDGRGASARASEARPDVLCGGRVRFRGCARCGRRPDRGCRAGTPRARVTSSAGNKISVRYMLETVREVTGKAFSSIKIPFSLAEFAARFTPWYYQQDEIQAALHALLAGSVAEQFGYQPRQGGPRNWVSSRAR